METSRHLNVTSIQFKFKWDTSNFCINCSKSADDFLQSSKIFNSSIEWLFLRLFPRRLSSKRVGKGVFKEYFPLCLYASADIKAIKNIKIFDNEGALLADETIDETRALTAYRCNIDGTDYWVSTIFILRDPIFNLENGSLNHDKITIVCEITYNDDETRSIKEQEEDILPRLEDDYEALLNDCKFSDVSLVSEGKVLKLHKCILASKNSVFSAMFETEMIERKDNRVEITDIKYDVLVEMIRYIYTRRVNNIETLAGELAIAADKYALDDLKIMCENSMINNLRLDSLVACLQLADKLRMDKLKEKGIEFIVKNACDIIDRTEFNLLPDSIVRQAFSMSNKRRQKFNCCKSF